MKYEIEIYVMCVYINDKRSPQLLFEGESYVDTVNYKSYKKLVKLNSRYFSLGLQYSTNRPLLRSMCMYISIK